ncbi:MAG: tRNA pseudouridine(55) synthase TruB, partial [Desulfobacteraceae bacterium]|nr:tRNA pseudouridine(55) synthase TruB [Desulfobacteraceae bacterium]
ILAINKPEGISSARVVARVKRVLGVKKIGHTGTLDPFATGLLLIAVQKATRISRFFLKGSKQYVAEVTLGIETDTYDCTGQTVFEAAPGEVNAISPEDVQKVVARFSGPQEQIPPSFSALKHNGQPLYKLARKGEMIKKPPRKIEIFSISVQHIDLPGFEMDVHCTGGTYIRSLAYDIGKKLKCGAHLSGLCRTKSSAFDLKDAIGLEDLEKMEPKEIEPYILPMSECLAFLPCVQADAVIEKKISYGQKLSKEEIAPFLPLDPVQAVIRMVDSSNQLLALIEPDKDGLSYNYCCVFTG